VLPDGSHLCDVKYDLYKTRDENTTRSQQPVNQTGMKEEANIGHLNICCI
jgi:hypothetical protein